MTKLRKFFASSVMVMTVVVMSGLTAPMTTNAAASAGDLIKKDGLSAVYYLGQDGKRYVFPNEATYKSWYSDFSGVVTISADELASYPLGGNVVVRPGTKLVKITTDPKVYAVEANGTLRQIPNEAAAIALYGADWAKRVIDVADSFFTNYTIGSPLASNEVPMGSLVKKTGETSIYYFDGTNYRLIEDEVAFLANRFQYANVLTLSSFTAGGSTITGAEAGIIKTSQGGSTGVVNPGQGTGLTVSLNSMTPASQSVPSTVGRIPFAKVNLTASADGIAYVDAITVKRTGLTTITGSIKVWAEKDGAIVASKKTLTSNDDAILNFSPVLTIPAGQTVTLDILAEVDRVSGNGALGIASASAISASGSTVSGSFPITGNTMSFTDYNVVVLTFDATTSTAPVKVGDENVELGKFGINFNTTSRDVIFNSITLRNHGLEDLSKVLMNVRIERNNVVISNNATFNGRYMTFTMKNGGYEMLKDDGNKTFVIKGDVIAKDVTGTPSLNLKLNKTEDIYAYEKATGFGASFVTPVVNSVVSQQNITSGNVTVSKKTTNPSAASIVKGTPNVLALVSNIKADEAIKAEGLKISYLNNTAAGAVDRSFQNVKVYLNNVLLESFNVTASSSSVYTEKLIDSAITLNKGDNEVKVTFDVKTNAESNDEIKFKLVGSSLLDVPEYASNGISVTGISGGAQGEPMTVKGALLTASINDGFSAGKVVVRGSSNVTLAKFAVKAENDKVVLTNIELSANNDVTTADQIHHNAVSDMELWADGSQIGTTRDFTGSGAIFSSLNYTIAKDTIKIIELKGSFDSVATGTFRTTAKFSGQDSVSKEVADKYATTTNFVIEESGSTTVSFLNSPSNGLLIAKASMEQEVAQFRFTAVNDSSNLSEIKIVNYDGSAATSSADARISAVKLYDGANFISSATMIGGTAEFKNLDNKFVVAANSNKVLTVKVVLNEISNDATSTNKQLLPRITTAKVKSSAGLSSDLTVNKSANTFLIRKTVPTVVSQSLTNVALPLTATDKVVAKFTVSADNNGDVEVGRFTMNFANSSATTTTSTAPLRINGSDVAAVASISGSQMTILLTNPEVISAGTEKTFEIIANIYGSGDDREVSFELVKDTAYDADSNLSGVDGNFVWSDGASLTTKTWNTGYNVKGLTAGPWKLSK